MQSLGWNHWSNSGSSPPSNQTVTFEMWPDLSEFSNIPLFRTDFHLRDGSSGNLFSSFTKQTVMKHFEWMHDYNLDGVLLQRFLSELRNPKSLRFRNQVAFNVMNASQQFDRYFALEYDTSGSDNESFTDALVHDIQYLKGIGMFDHSQYIHCNGKPVLAIWGFGFLDHPGSQQQCISVIQSLKEQFYLIGGVPYYWRTSDRDSKPNYSQVYEAFDALSPWAVGRWKKDTDFTKNLYHQVVYPDKLQLDKNGQGYGPVMWPGFSWSNLQRNPSLFNEIPRQAGKFFTSQSNLLVPMKPLFLKIAMFDEVDEGTAMFKVCPSSKSHSPVDGRFLCLDADGDNLPSDFYLRLAANVTTQFHKLHDLHNIKELTTSKET